MQHPISRDSFDDSWRPRLSQLLGLARAGGADFAEFFLERRNYVSLSVENGRLTDVSPRLSLGAGLRLFKGQTDCYVSTNDVSAAGLKQCVEKALGLLNLSLPATKIFTPEINLDPLRDYGAIRKKNVWDKEWNSISEINQVMLTTNQLVQKKVQKLESANTNYFRDWQEVMVAASDGIFARDIRMTQSLSASALCADGAHRASVGDRKGVSGHPRFLDIFNADNIVDPIVESTGKMLYADYVTAGEYPIIMANDFGGVIFHEACGHLLETTQIERKTTPFLEKKGELIANPALTAWDEGMWDSAFGTLDMDDEGMPVQRTLLIENGILKQFISDRMGQLKTGHPRTGSGRRQNYTFAAASRMRNTYIGAGPHKVDDLFASVDKGIYCKRMGGGSVGATGQFNFAVQEAYLIENGKLTKPLKGATLIGEAVDVMNKISMCADDLSLAPGFCGSVSGSIYVTVGQPHIKVDAITVGGRAS